MSRGGHPSRSDPRAEALVVSVLGGGMRPERARFLAPEDAKKNVLVDYRVGDERFVLKVYRQSWRYTLQALKNPISRHVTRSFNLRSLAPARVQAELDGIAGFREAGLCTFEVVDRPRRDALVFRWVAGEPLRTRIRALQDPVRTREYVRRVAADMRARHALAGERGDLRMVHPAPRLQHVWLLPDDALLYYDFEDRVNPSLTVEEALACETEYFFFYLLRTRETADAATIAFAREALGEEVLGRWRAGEARRRSRISGSARRRRWVLDAVFGAER